MSLKKIKKITEELDEAKQVGTLYHYTWLNNLILILRDNKLKSQWSMDTHNYSSSFTRNKNFKKGYVYNIPLECTIVVDGDKLSEKYKIYPIEYYYTQRGISPNPEAKESEERISFKDDEGGIENFKDYIKEIILYPKEYKKSALYKKYKWSYKELIEELKSFGVTIKEI